MTNFIVSRSFERFPGFCLETSRGSPNCLIYVRDGNEFERTSMLFCLIYLIFNASRIEFGSANCEIAVQCVPKTDLKSMSVACAFILWIFRLWVHCYGQFYTECQLHELLFNFKVILSFDCFESNFFFGSSSCIYLLLMSASYPLRVLEKKDHDISLATSYEIHGGNKGV